MCQSPTNVFFSQNRNEYVLKIFETAILLFIYSKLRRSVSVPLLSLKRFQLLSYLFIGTYLIYNISNYLLVLRWKICSIL